MMLHELKKSPGRTKSGKRVGRGDSSGAWNYCGKGMKGQKLELVGMFLPGLKVDKLLCTWDFLNWDDSKDISNY